MLLILHKLGRSTDLLTKADSGVLSYACIFMRPGIMIEWHNGRGYGETDFWQKVFEDLFVAFDHRARDHHRECG